MIARLINRVVEAAGVDALQWRALLRAYVMLDYGALFGAYGSAAAQQAGLRLVLHCLFLGMLGMLPAFVIAFARDLFFASIVMVTMLASLVATFSLMKAPTVIVPDDYAIVGYRPVTSQTYFAARITGLFTQTMEIVVLAGCVPVAAFFVRSGGSVLVAGAAFVAITASALAATLTVAAVYGWLLQRISPARLETVVTATALVGLLLVLSVGAFGYVAFVDFGVDGFSVKVDQTIIRSVWTLFYPAVWFAAYLEVARGTAGPIEWTACALSIAVMLVLAATMRGRTATGYANQVGRVTTVSVAHVGPEADWGFLANERRAMAVLLRHLVRTDMTLQMGVVTQIAMALGLTIFLSMDIPTDPFLSSASNLDPSGMFLLFLLPRSLRQDLAASESSRASWLFFSTPADRAKLVTGMRDLVAICVLPILFAGVGSFFVYAYGDVGHALIDAAVLCLVSYIILQLDALFDPRLPFSRPVIDRRARGLSPRGSWGGLLGCVMVYQFVARSRRLVYSTEWTLALGVLSIAVLIGLLVWLTQRRVARKIWSAEYAE
jgi:hypothetical protein